jgi:hypothetical protein
VATGMKVKCFISTMLVLHDRGVLDLSPRVGARQQLQDARVSQDAKDVAVNSTKRRTLPQSVEDAAASRNRRKSYSSSPSAKRIIVSRLK